MAKINPASPNQPTSGAPSSTTPFVPTMVLDQTQSAYVAQYLQSEIKDVLTGSDRADFLENVKKWRKMRIAQPDQKSKSFPWQKASNVRPPIMAQKTNTIFSKEVAAFSTKRPYWTVGSDDSKFEKQSEVVSTFMNSLARNPYGLNMNKVNREGFYDQVSLGTLFKKVPWLVDQWQIKKPDGSTVWKTMHNGPAIVNLQIEDVVTRSYWSDIQRSPWFGHRSWLMWHELKQREALGIYQNVDLIKQMYATALPDYLQSEMDNRGFSAGTMGAFDETKMYPIFEVYLFYDADGDGIPEDIIVWIELETGTILRAEPNYLSVRPFVAEQYFPLPGELYGIGTGHMVQDLQDEVDFLHNHRNDNLMLALLPMFKAKRGSGISPREELHPLKIMLLDNPETDFTAFEFPDLTASTYNAEMLARDYADRVTGANDPMSGFADQTLKSGANGSTMAFQAQEGNSILNAILENLEEREGEVGQLVLMQLIANREKVDLSSLSPEEQILMTEVLNTPIEDVPSKFKFKIQTTDAAKSENARKQNFLMVAQLYQMYGQSTMPLLQIAANPQVPPDIQTFANKLLLGSTELVGKIIEFSDIGEPDNYMPFLDDLRAKVALIDQQKAQIARQLEVQSAGSTGQLGTGGPSNGNVPGGLGNSVPGNPVPPPSVGMAGQLGGPTRTPGIGGFGNG